MLKNKFKFYKEFRRKKRFIQGFDKKLNKKKINTYKKNSEAQKKTRNYEEINFLFEFTI
jgi:hypothetical protein